MKFSLRDVAAYLIVAGSAMIGGCAATGGWSVGSSIGGKPIGEFRFKSCSRAINYDAAAIQIEGLSIPYSGNSIEIAKFSASRERLREATEIVAIADIRQFEACQRAIGTSSSRDHEEAKKARDNLYACAFAMTQASTDARLQFAIELCRG